MQIYANEWNKNGIKYMEMTSARVRQSNKLKCGFA